MSYAFWDVEFCKMYRRNVIAYLWIDYDEVKFDGYVLLDPDSYIYLKWKKLEEKDKEPPEYYEYAELIIGESSMDEDIESLWGLDTGTRKIFVNPNYVESLIPDLIKDMLRRHREEWIMAWLLCLAERSEFWKKNKSGKVRKVGNSYVISVSELEEGKRYRKIRPKHYENLLIIYRPHGFSE